MIKMNPKVIVINIMFFSLQRVPLSLPLLVAETHKGIFRFCVAKFISPTHLLMCWAQYFYTKLVANWRVETKIKVDHWFSISSKRKTRVSFNLGWILVEASCVRSGCHLEAGREKWRLDKALATSSHLG